MEQAKYESVRDDIEDNTQKGEKGRLIDFDPMERHIAYVGWQKRVALAEREFQGVPAAADAL